MVPDKQNLENLVSKIHSLVDFYCVYEAANRVRSCWDSKYRGAQNVATCW